ncbi:MAG: VPLPA-CTERM sorting domain-containing protein, partial [Pseudomonadota bacterium]
VIVALALCCLPAVAQAAVKTLTLVGGLASAVDQPSLGLVAGQPVATLQGSVTFDAAALVVDFDATPVTDWTLDLTPLVAVPLLPAGPAGYGRGDIAFDAEPMIGLVGGVYVVDFLASVNFAGVDLALEASPFDDLIELFDADFNLLADGSLAVVPLPAAVWMFGAGIAGLVALRRRRDQLALSRG